MIDMFTMYGRNYVKKNLLGIRLNDEKKFLRQFVTIQTFERRINFLHIFGHPFHDAPLLFVQQHFKT